MTKPMSIILAAALVGCAAPGMPVPGVTARATLAVHDAEGRRLLAAVNPWVKADIDHVTLTLAEQGQTQALGTLTIAKADLGKSVTFKDLHQSTQYVVTAKAWADAGEATRIDNQEADAATCTTAFATGTDAQVDVGAIKLRLRDKTFEGRGTSTGVGVTDGQVIDTTAATAIELL